MKTRMQVVDEPGLYDTDVIAWANRQAALLRAGRFGELDIEHIADEIEDVGKSEQRELANRMAVLLKHLIKWQFQPERRGNSWLRTIKEQRKGIARRLRRTPSLSVCLNDPEWWADAWGDAVSAASSEAGLGDLPEDCPWPGVKILDPEWVPDSIS
jgi:hypothetical protein